MSVTIILFFFIIIIIIWFSFLLKTAGEVPRSSWNRFLFFQS